MSFRIKVPSNVKSGVHKLPHVQMIGGAAVLHDPSGVTLHITPTSGKDEAEVSVSIDESVVKQKLEKDIATIAGLPEFNK